MTLNKDNDIVFLDTLSLAKYSSNVIKRGLKLASSLILADDDKTTNGELAQTNFIHSKHQCHSWKCVYIFDKNFQDLTSIAISPNGQILASFDLNGKIKVQSLLTGEIIFSLDPDYHPLASNLRWTYLLAISNNNDFLVSTCKGEIKFWNLDTGTLARILTMPESLPFSINHEKWMVAVTNLKKEFSEDPSSAVPEINIWCLASGTLNGTFEIGSGVLAVPTFSANGQFFAKSGKSLVHFDKDWEETVEIWDIDSRKILYELTGFSTDGLSVEISPNNQLFITIDSLIDGFMSNEPKIQVWNLQSGQLLYTLDDNSWRNPIIINKNLQLIACDSNCAIKIWNLQSGQLVHTLIGHSGVVISLSSSPDGNVLASASNDGNIKIWDLRTGKFLQNLEGHSGLIQFIEFNHDGSILISKDNEGVIRTWQPFPNLS